MKKSFAFGAAIVAVFLGCASRNSDQTPVIAQVGKAKLTLNDVQQSIPPEYSSVVSLEQYKEYVRRWSDSEVLYQEALRKKLDKNSAIARKIEHSRRDILVAEVINQYCSNQTDVPEQKIVQYYEDHQKEFTRENWELKAIHMVIPDEKTAWDVRQKITVENFQDMARQHSIDPVDDSMSLSYTSSRDILPELTAEVFKIKIGGTTPIIKTARGFYILRILDKQAPGSTRTLSEVRDEIVSRLTAGRQKKQVQELINSLRKESPVSLYFERLPGVSRMQAQQDAVPRGNDTSSDSIP